MQKTLNQQVKELRQQMENIVLQAAKEIPGYGFMTYYADGTWTVRMLPDGTCVNEGYAEERRGRMSHVSALETWELGRLVDEITTGEFRNREDTFARLTRHR
jgi:hypothetical protein